MICIKRTNNAWENLRLLRELKKKTGYSYTKGLINRDWGGFYVANDDRKCICCSKYGDGSEPIFNYEEYFKGKLKTFYTVHCNVEDDTQTLESYVGIEKRYETDSTSPIQAINNSLKYWNDIKDSCIKRYDNIIKQIEELKQ